MSIVKPDDQLIAEVRELDAKATPEPWVSKINHAPYKCVWFDPEDNYTTLELKAEDADFIAAARTLLPDLANRLEAANERDKARWRPVEEAKDGEQILLKTKYGIIEVTWDAENQCGDLYISHDMQLYGNVFMPLPEPPTKPTP